MKKVEKKFPYEMLNADDAPHILPEGAAVNLRNARMHASVDGKTGYYENIMQNLKVSGQDGKIPAGSERVASWEDSSGRFAIWFTHVAESPDLDQINLYDFIAGKYWLIAKANMGVNGVIQGGLGFKFGHFYDLVYENKMLYWTGPDHQPRKLHVGAAIKATDPAAVGDSPFYTGWRYDWVNTGDDDTSNKNLSLAAKPPAFPPLISKRKDPDVGTNNLTGESFQFATQFVFYTREESTLSMFSESSLINSEEDQEKNVIDVTIDAKEFPLPQGLKEMRLYVKRATDKNAFLVKTWTVEELLATNVVSYSFFGNHYGVALAPAVLAEPAHSVPRRAATIEIIKNRIMLGDCLEGYNTPAKTSMTLQLGAAIGIDGLNPLRVPIQRVMYRGIYRNGGTSRPRFYYSGLYVKLDSVPVPGYYYIPGTEIRWNAGFTGVPAVFTSVPSSVNIASLVFKGASLSDIIENTRSWNIHKIYESYIQQSATDTIPVVGLLTSGYPKVYPAFLHKSDFVAGMCFFDRWMQRCGVITNDGIRVSVPVRNFGLSVMYNDMRWSLSNDNALEEIPDWAEKYAPLFARNSRTGSFVSGTSEDTRYGRVDPETGEYKYDDGKEASDPGNDDSPYLNYSDAAVSIGLDTTSLVNSALGYTFAAGDICILVAENNDVFYLPVLGQDGKYIRVGAKDIGPLTGKKFAYEVYTPFKTDAQDFFYEVGQMFLVSEPGTANRRYSQLSGSFKPDTYILERRNGLGSAYRAYAMSPNDLFWKRWDTHFGRANVVLDIGEAQKTGNISYGDPYIPGSSVNNLNAFHAISETNNIPAIYGPIKKLKGTTKAQGEGNVLLAICEAGVASVYIGEVEVQDQSGSRSFIKTDRIIGQINPLGGDYGTSHPESVKDKDGQVFWYSHIKRAFVRYDTNGIFPISSYKFNSAAFKFSKQIDAEKAQGKLVMVNAGIDHLYKEYLVQKKAFDQEQFGGCAIVSGLSVDYAGTVPNPERVVISWANPSNGVFSWKIFDFNNYLVSGNQDYSPGTDPATIEILGLIVGTPYRIEVIRKCGGENVSPAATMPIYIAGIAPPPLGECVKPSYVDDDLPFAGKVGYSISIPIEFGGTMPFSISDIVKPDWMNVSLSGRIVTLSGLPAVEDVTESSPISFKISNCSVEFYEYSNTITISL